MSRVAEAVFDQMALNTLIFCALFGFTLLIKTVLKNKLSAAMHYAVWLVVAARLLLPVNVSVLWSPYVWFEPEKPQAAINVSDGSASHGSEKNIRVNDVIAPPAGVAEEPPDIARNTETASGWESAVAVRPVTVSWKTVAVCVWLLGIVCFTAWFSYRSMRFRKKIKRCVTCEVPQWLTDEFNRCKQKLGIKRDVGIVVQGYLPVPAIMGVLKPLLVIPDRIVRTADIEQARHVFVHELMHCKRKDLWAIFMLNILNAAYWFNPFVWLGIRLIHRDMETACDSMAVQALGTESRRAYIRTILYFSGKQRNALTHAAMSLNDGCTKMRKRIQGMFLVRKTKRPVKVFVAILACMMALAGFTAGCETPPGSNAGLNAISNQAAGISASLVQSVSRFIKTAPSASEGSDKAVILIPSFDAVWQYKSTIERINSTLEKAGQNVEIKLRTDLYASLYENLKKEAASGSFSATAYALDVGYAADTFNEKITMDLTDMIRANAPKYYAKYSVLCAEMFGIPVGINQGPMPHKLALMLRDDFEQSCGGIASVTEFLQFVDREITPAAKKYSIFVEPYQLIEQWALEQGFYPVTYGYLFTSLRDGGTLVGLEDIPGFRDFLTRLFTYYRNLALSGSSVGVSIIGFVNYLDVYYKPAYYCLQDWVPWIKGQFKAQVFSPDQPAFSYSPFCGEQQNKFAYDMELAVPAVSPQDKAADVIRFVEWLYSGQDNYDMVLYGEKGKDFTESNGRFTPLVQGVKADIQKWESFSRYYFAWPGSRVFGNSAFSRVPYFAPDNLDEAVKVCVAASRSDTNGSYVCREFVQDIEKNELIPQDIREIERKRHRLMLDCFCLPSYALTKLTDRDVNRLLDSLAALDSMKYIDAYNKMILKYIE